MIICFKHIKKVVFNIFICLKEFAKNIFKNGQFDVSEEETFRKNPKKENV